MQNSILKYYGLTDFAEIIYHSFEDAYPDTPEKKLINLLEKQKVYKVVLFISFNAKTIIERKDDVVFLLEQRFGLCCTFVCERQLKGTDGVIRVCAVLVQSDQFSKLLKILHDYSSYSFVVVLDRIGCVELCHRLVSLVEDGLLTPKIIKNLSNTVLKYEASFVHILRGNDGYSINYFSPSNRTGDGLREPF